MEIIMGPRTTRDGPIMEPIMGLRMGTLWAHYGSHNGPCLRVDLKLHVMIAAGLGTLDDRCSEP